MSNNKVYVWDRLVRVFHWTLVLAFATSYLSGESEHPVHVWSGYLILGLIILRILWGFIGTPPARFRNFLRSPGAAWRYLAALFRGRSRRHIGHNPAGGWMTVALLVSLLATGLSGLQLYGVEGKGPLAAFSAPLTGETAAHAAEHPDEELWEEVHEFLANFTLFLVALHIAGVIASSFAHRENLPKAMVTGYKRAGDRDPARSKPRGKKPPSKCNDYPQSRSPGRREKRGAVH